MIVRITSKRQVTFPARVLDALGVGPGDQIEIVEGPGDIPLLAIADVDPLAVVGCDPGGPLGRLQAQTHRSFPSREIVTRQDPARTWDV